MIYAAAIKNQLIRIRARGNVGMHAYYYLVYRTNSTRIAMYELIGITRGSVRNYSHTRVCPRVYCTIQLYIADIGSHTVVRELPFRIAMGSFNIFNSFE